MSSFADNLSLLSQRRDSAAGEVISFAALSGSSLSSLWRAPGALTKLIRPVLANGMLLSSDAASGAPVSGIGASEMSYLQGGDGTSSESSLPLRGGQGQWRGRLAPLLSNFKGQSGPFNRLVATNLASFAYCLGLHRLRLDSTSVLSERMQSGAKFGPFKDINLKDMFEQCWGPSSKIDDQIL